MLVTLGYIQFPTHRVHISQDPLTNRIYCFKSTPTRCDLAAFDDSDSAGDYILEPFPSLVCELVLTEDQGQ
jgi:hypothetical protein